MKIAEAAEKWGVKPEKVIEYLYTKGIEGITCDGVYINISELEIPDIYKPDVKMKKSEHSNESIYRKILKAYANKRYVNAVILCISDEEFESSLEKLAEGGYLKPLDKPDEPCLMLRYTLTDAGSDAAAKRQININITQNFSLIHM